MRHARQVDLVRLVYLVCFVYLVDLVHLVSFVQPNKPDRPDRLVDLLSTLLVRIQSIQPDRLIFGLGSVYRGGTIRETLDVKREAKDTTDWLSVR